MADESSQIEPVNSGVQAGQKPERALLTRVDDSDRLSQVLYRYTDVGLKGQTIDLLQVQIRQGEKLLDETIATKRALEIRAHELNEQLNKERVITAVLKTEIANGFRTGWLSNILITAGGILIGLAAPLAQTSWPTFTTLIVGIVLLVAGYVKDLVRPAQNGKE